jgi:xylulokinase
MNREPHLMGLDIGSSAVKCIVMTLDGKIKASAAYNYPIDSPHPGWVEQDPKQWWSAALQAIQTCVSLVAPEEIQAVSFSGHMSAAVLLDESGVPVYPSILVADTRSSEQTRFLREHYMNEFVSLTGNEPLDAFVVSRLLWVQKHAPDALAKTKNIIFPKDYIRYRLTGHLGTEPTDAGNTLLYNRHTGKWHNGLIQELGLNPAQFPELCRSSDVVASISRQAASLTGLLQGTPVVAGGADMACSQLGSGAVKKGTMAVTLSTSAQVVMQVKEPLQGCSGQVTYHPSTLADSMYAMGTVFTGGLGVDWGYRLLTGKANMDSSDYNQLMVLSESMEHIPPGSNGLLFLPFLVGSGTPYFDSQDRASWLGLSLGQDKSLLLHSIMEGVGYNIRESMALFEQGGAQVDHIHIGGGGSKNPVWCRMIGDILGKDISMLANRDASAVGAAILAGVGSGSYSSVESGAEIAVGIRDTLYHSAERHQKYNGIYERYLNVYRSVNSYYQHYKDEE